MRKIKILVLILLLTEAAFGTIRYVSKTGTSIPPYTSWETASDSIQKCINICVDGDTVIVANGVYKESLIINAAITFIGSSMDSCIIDGRGLAPFTVNVKNNLDMYGFRVFGQRFDKNNVAIVMLYNSLNINMNISSCKISDCGYGINTGKSSGLLNNLIITKAYKCIGTWCASDTCKPKLTNSLIIVENEVDADAFYSSTGGRPILLNNILLSRIENGQSSNSWGITSDTEISKVIKNNLFGGFLSSISTGSSDDSTIVHNNVFTGQNYSNYGVFYSVRRSLFAKNNVISNNQKVFFFITSQPELDYNIFWNNGNLLPSPYHLGDHDIHEDPMFVKDTLASSQKGDFHLQMYSPGIDAGDPSILDVDGSRSDIGLFGGPLGQKYTYLDLAPKPPRNLTAQLTDGQILLTWNRNSEADLFRYRVYRDTVPGFIYDTSKIIGVVSDTFFVDNLPDYYRAGTYYYKITAIDSAFNQSPASEEITVVVTGAAEGPPVVTEEYKLLQNYPNPFNPSTVIPYRLKEGGYVKIMVYNLLGELVKVLQNGYQNPGYYEVDFSPTKEERRKGEGILEFETFYRNDVVSGIYLYRIEIIGEGNIPRFMDMKKMMLVK
ncbi:MAG: hypothetical protein AB9882_01930 [Ignavibacteriaceae bacterium]